MFQPRPGRDACENILEMITRHNHRYNNRRHTGHTNMNTWQNHGAHTRPHAPQAQLPNKAVPMLQALGALCRVPEATGLVDTESEGWLGQSGAILPQVRA